MSDRSTQLEGRAAAPGVAVAPAFLLQEHDLSAAVEEVEPDDPETEKGRLDVTLDRTEAELLELADRVTERAGAEEGEIFEAHAEFASDPELRRRAHAAIDDGASAEAAARSAFDSFKELLAASASEYLAARADDLDDVRDRVVGDLLGVDVADVPTQRAVVVAGTLTPSQTADLPFDLIAGIVTATGSPTSHAAILARSLGIPAVVGADGVLEAVEPGMPVAVDGSTGEVIAGPDEDERRRFEERAQEAERRREQLAALRDEHGQTADGHRVELAANVNDPERLELAGEVGAEGSGLVRTEFLFLDREEAPSVDEQADYYTRVLSFFPGDRVVFRTMDIGADKPLRFVEREAEENPALGVRGIRLGLVDTDLLRDQLRALVRAHRRSREGDGESGRLAIMFPLVSIPAELHRAQEMLEEIAADEEVPLGDVEVGVMIEVPAAALAIRSIAPDVDFVSIGTNDLLQYLFAADRLVAEVADLADPANPVVLRLIGDVVEVVGEAGGWVGVCGEAAAAPELAAAFVGLGVHELSMTPAAIPEVKALLRDVTIDELRNAVSDALETQDPAEARSRLQELVAG
jgi:phosphoenolpyruvate-protein phosphotransferase